LFLSVSLLHSPLLPVLVLYYYYATSGITSIAVSVIAFSKTGLVFTSTREKIWLLSKGVFEKTWETDFWSLDFDRMVKNAVQVTVGVCRWNMTVGGGGVYGGYVKTCEYVYFSLLFGILLCDCHVGCTCLSPW
jgi:hypothetical protein